MHRDANMQQKHNTTADKDPERLHFYSRKVARVEKRTKQIVVSVTAKIRNKEDHTPCTANTSGRALAGRRSLRVAGRQTQTSKLQSKDPKRQSERKWKSTHQP